MNTDAHNRAVDEYIRSLVEKGMAKFRAYVEQLPAELAALARPTMNLSVPAAQQTEQPPQEQSEIGTSPLFGADPSHIKGKRLRTSIPGVTLIIPE